MGCFVVAGFVLTSMSPSPSAIAELLVNIVKTVGLLNQIWQILTRCKGIVAVSLLKPELLSSDL